MRYTRIVFLLAGIYGLLVLTPQYFLADAIARKSGPMSHPEFFYGFIGVALAWQVMFLLIARDPQRHRWAILPGIGDKLAFGAPSLILYLQGRLGADVMMFGAIDLIWAVLFAVAFLRTPEPAG